MKKEIRNNLILFLVSIFISLLLAEIGLRIVFDYRHRNFIIKEKDGIQYYFTNTDSWDVLHGQYFLKDKPDGTYRIFTFGGSTTEGSIHQGKVSFTKFLEWKLNDLLPAVPVEVINFGKRGEASRHVLKKIKEALKYDPDLFIIYSGHNEFLRFDEKTSGNMAWIEEIFGELYLYKRVFERISGRFIDQTPLYLTEIRQLEDKLICSPAEFKEVQKEYEENIKEIVRIAKESRVDIILSNVAGNYKGWEPNRSVHKVGLSDEQLNKWQYYFFRGKKLQQENKFEIAISEYKMAQEIDPGFAEVNYQLARSYEDTGLFDEAKKEYLKAVDNDADPKRASTIFNRVIENACRDFKVSCIDVIGAFENASENSLIGYNIMVDAHHPSVPGELIIAKEIVRVMAENGLIVSAPKWSFDNDKPDDWYLTKPDLTDADEVLFHQNRGLWFTKLATRRFDPADRLERAESHFKKANDIDPESFRNYVGFAIVDLLGKRVLRGKEFLQKACKISSKDTVKVLNDVWTSNLLLTCRLKIDENCNISSF